MNRRILILPALLFFFLSRSFAGSGFEIGIGSGHVFYGDSAARGRTGSIRDASQAVIFTDAAFLLPVNDFVIFSFGGDLLFDLRWRGSDHVYLVDYAFLAGLRVYPDFGGLFASVDYALGRRTDFFSIGGHSSHDSSEWGNGFKIGLGYDFSYHMSSFGPEIAAALKSVPRGGVRRDNLLSVSMKLTRHK